MKCMENLIAQFQGNMELDGTLPMHKLLGLDKQLRRICGALKVKMVKKVQLEQQHIEGEEHKLAEIRNVMDYDDGMREDIQK